MTELIQERLETYERDFMPRLLSHLDEASGQKVLNAFEWFKRRVREKTVPVFLKLPGENVFVTWDVEGFSERVAESDKSKQSPRGLFYYDTQHLDCFRVQRADGSAFIQERVDNPNPRKAEYRHISEIQPELTIRREETLVRENSKPVLVEMLDFGNATDTHQTVQILLGMSGKDVYECRWNPNTKSGGKLQIERTFLPAVINRHANGMDVTFSMISAFPVGGQPENTLRTRLAFEASDLQAVQVEPFGESQNAVILTLELPAKSSLKFGFKVIPTNTIREAFERPPFDEQAWEQAFPVITLKTKNSEREKIWREVWDTARDDTLALLIPVHAGNAVFYSTAAGYPNFGRVFARDSILSCFQLLPYLPQLAAHTLQGLACYQGKEDNVFNEEAPGKIFLEVSTGELARLKLVPHGPYYGCEDSTPLFVMLLHAYVTQTQDDALLEKLWPNFLAALGFLERQTTKADNPVPGFQPMRRGTHPRNIDLIDDHLHGRLPRDQFAGLRTTTWKDHEPSFRLIPDEEGRLDFPAHYPLYPAELQGYLYGAWLGASELFARKGDADNAERYRTKAGELKQRFNEAFWSEAEQFMVIALDGLGQPIEAIASNGAQALWSGIVEADKAHRMGRRLIEKDDLLSGWGLRTLSSKHPAYDPISYHNGGVWPHDTSIVAAGLKRYGLDAETAEVSRQMLDAALTFPQARLPEVYTAFQREAGDTSVPIYPDTCTIQAWAAGTPFLLLSALLGLEADSRNRILHFKAPRLPEEIDAVALSGLKPWPGANAFIACERADAKQVQVISETGSTGLHIEVATGQSQEIAAAAR